MASRERRIKAPEWSALRQLTTGDRRGLGAAAVSKRTRELRSRTPLADKVVKSVCPYCAVGCGQNVYVKDGRVTQIEGDPDSPISRGRLCPKGSASLQLTTGQARQYKVRCRRPGGTDWEDLELDTALEMIADRVISARRKGWQWEQDGRRTRRTASCPICSPGRPPRRRVASACWQPGRRPRPKPRGLLSLGPRQSWPPRACSCSALVPGGAISVGAGRPHQSGRAGRLIQASGLLTAGGWPEPRWLARAEAAKLDGSDGMPGVPTRG